MTRNVSEGDGLILSKPKVPSDWRIDEYLAAQKERVDARLKQLPLSPGKPTKAREAMRYALDSKGKRFRPLLTIAAADIYRLGHSDLVLDCAVAIECIHTASLVFDDLPCMDDAKLRRGRQPTHLVYGESQATLAGMSLIAEANQLVSRGTRERRRSLLQKRLECLHILNGSFSIEGLSGGQSDDLLNKTSLSLAEVEYIHAKKTGSLFVACVETAAVLADATPNERQWLKSFAKNLGLAFQIQDDLLDLKSSGETGKDQHQDQGKTNFVSLAGERQCRVLYNDLIEVALKNLEPFGASAFHLLELTRLIQQRPF